MDKKVCIVVVYFETTFVVVTVAFPSEKCVTLQVYEYRELDLFVDQFYT